MAGASLEPGWNPGPSVLGTKKVNFDFTINMGTIVHLIGMLTAGFAVYAKIRERMVKMENTIEHLSADLSQFRIDLAKITDLLLHGKLVLRDNPRASSP